MGRPGAPTSWIVLVASLGLWAMAVSPGLAQIQMPDPREMSGLPLPSGELPAGTVSVRLIRGQLSNNVVDHPVELRTGEDVVTARTDENGRARFEGLAPGTTVTAETTVDDERLESQRFTVPTEGGIRVMLVATLPGDDPGTASEAGSASQPGEVTLGGETRVHIEFTDDALQMYYLLDIVNARGVPVTPSATLVFDMPTGAQGTTLLASSTRDANVVGNRVTAPGPFPPGRTPLHIAYVMPQRGVGTVRLTQTFPAELDQVAVVAQKLDEARLSSAQLTEQRELSPGDDPFILGRGPGLAAGEPLTLELSGLPHHSRTPRYVALALALVIVVAGVWASVRTGGESAEADQRKLVAKRDRLLAELVRLKERAESDDAGLGRGGRPRDAGRRRELTAELVRIYGALGLS